MKRPGAHFQHRLVQAVESPEAVLGGVGDELLHHAVVGEGVLQPLGVAHGVLQAAVLRQAQGVGRSAHAGADALGVRGIHREPGVDAHVVLVIVEIPR